MSPEIDEGNEYTSYGDALAMVLSNVRSVGIERFGIDLCTGFVLAEDVAARVSSPTNDVSLKDGFTVRAADVAKATLYQPVRLHLMGSAFAGKGYSGTVSPGSAVKIMSGSPLPAGADTVIAGELCYETPEGEVDIMASVEKGQNVFPAGGDLKAGEIIASKGQVLTGARLGLIAAGGVDQLKVYRKPKVALVGIGDEVVAPGKKLEPGQLYASNLVNLSGWLSAFGIPSQMRLAGDNADAIKKELLRLLPEVDVILTSGGAWGSERDLVLRTLDELGWKKLFHHVRMGPGKGIGFGIWEGKPVFCLPGGPPSNQMAFLQLALPGILRMAGQDGQALPTALAILTEDIKRRHIAWTEFRSGKLSTDMEGNYRVTPYSAVSRLKSMAESTCLICIPEGTDSLKSGHKVIIQILAPRTFGLG